MQRCFPEPPNHNSALVVEGMQRATEKMYASKQKCEQTNRQTKVQKGLIGEEKQKMDINFSLFGSQGTKKVSHCPDTIDCFCATKCVIMFHSFLSFIKLSSCAHIHILIHVHRRRMSLTSTTQRMKKSQKARKIMIIFPKLHSLCH